MIYSVNFVDMTLKLNPLAVTKYLSETNWELYPIKRNDIKIFQYKKEDLFEQVTIPLDKKLRDYKNVMYDSVCKIAYVEKKSVEQLMLYLLNPNTDILKIRLDKKEVESGNIMFDDAIQLFDNAKKLIAATALDVINPKKIHYGRINEPVRNFLSQCRFGQTEIGSYVVSVICPFVDFTGTVGYKKINVLSDEEQCANSLTRKVINRLLTNIATIKQEIDAGNLESLVNYDSPISSNFYEACPPKGEFLHPRPLQPHRPQHQRHRPLRQKRPYSAGIEPEDSGAGADEALPLPGVRRPFSRPRGGKGLSPQGHREKPGEDFPSAGAGWPHHHHRILGAGFPKRG